LDNLVIGNRKNEMGEDLMSPPICLLFKWRFSPFGELAGLGMKPLIRHTREN